MWLMYIQGHPWHYFKHNIRRLITTRKQNDVQMMTGIRRWRLSERQNVNGTITIVMRYNNNNIMKASCTQNRSADYTLFRANPFHYIGSRIVSHRLRTGHQTSVYKQRPLWLKPLFLYSVLVFFNSSNH